MEVVKPAELDYLAIYNPSLGPTDETLHDQIVYYYSRKSSESQKSSRSSSDDQDREERNERLRRIGLAQGMIEFAKYVHLHWRWCQDQALLLCRAFSDGAPVDAVDSEHSRILMHELEAGWWLLAVSHYDHSVGISSSFVSRSISHRYTTSQSREVRSASQRKQKLRLSIRRGKSALKVYFSSSCLRHTRCSCFIMLRHLRTYMYA